MTAVTLDYGLNVAGFVLFAAVPREPLAPVPSPVMLTVQGGVGTAELDATDGSAFYWKAREVLVGRAGTIRYVTVPAAGPVTYASLARVPREWLNPDLEPDTAWALLATQTQRLARQKSVTVGAPSGRLGALGQTPAPKAGALPAAISGKPTSVKVAGIEVLGVGTKPVIDNHTARLDALEAALRSYGLLP